MCWPTIPEHEAHTVVVDIPSVTLLEKSEFFSSPKNYVTVQLLTLS